MPDIVAIVTEVYGEVIGHYPYIMYALGGLMMVASLTIIDNVLYAIEGIVRR